MLKVSNLSIRFNTKTLFENVNLEFKSDNCYGIIGANGAGKSTFLKIISGTLEPTKGEVITGKGERISILSQNHHEFDSYTVIETVIMGNSKLYNIMKEKDALYLKEDFTFEDGIKVGELEEAFASMGGWQAESDAAILLKGLGISNELHNTLMSELKDAIKVKVLLAKALFGEPDILLLDEPTNGLDLQSIRWLEEFLINFKNIVLVVSHDRYFLNQVCTCMVDIDYGKITLFAGNYDFWYQSSQLLQKQMKESNKKKEEKMKELEDFIRRFSANASKSKQATSRKKALEKIVLDNLVPSNRKYPYINFDFDKNVSKNVIVLEKICYKDILKDFSLTIYPGDKIALIGPNEIAKTTLLNILAGKLDPDSGKITVGSNVIISYYPKNHEEYFASNQTLLEWLRNYSENKDETFVRGFLGRMLFSGEDALKNVKVLSGGEKVRAMFSKLMLNRGNVLLLDEPTNHLDIEAITSLNDGLEKFLGVLVFSSFDQELIETVSNRLIEIKSDGTYKDKRLSYQEYIEKFGLGD